MQAIPCTSSLFGFEGARPDPYAPDAVVRSPFRRVGVDYGEVPPVPIPNTVVKLTCADDTWLETARENRFSPTLY